MSKEKRFKMPSSYTVLMIIISLMAILTWFIPAGRYQSDADGNVMSGTYEKVENTPQGAYDVLMAPVNAMLGKDTVVNEGTDKEYTIHTDGAIKVAFFIIMVGAFLGVVTETGALDVGIASIVKKFKGREKLLIPILMFLFALGGTTYGMGEETMAFYPLLIPVMLAVGFDTITAVAIILVGSQIGCLASTVNPFATGVASDAANISVADGIVLRLIFFFVLLALGILFVYRYASKIEKDPTKSYVFKQREDDLAFFKVGESVEQQSLTKRQKYVLGVFVATFIIMILSLIPWTKFGINLFVDINNGIQNIPGVGQIFGHSLELGEWYFPEVTMLFVFMGVLVGIVSGMGEQRFIKAFMNGAADLLSVALICAVARGIQIIMNDGQISATILHSAEGFLSGFSSQVFIVLTYIFYLPMSFLIPSSSGLAGATIGIMAPLGEFAKVPASLVVTAFQSASGVLNLLAPTSGIVMGALAIGRIDLGTWIKFISKFIVIVVVVSILLLILGTMI
ncbi:YfcC family protein [Granulicatella sp. zg-ZJ]|uniref:YfcC family protein n=1 Tax=unclassified Granulicatella TaxID=2630493 RepID=UPI0013C1AD55|nr:MULTISPECIES: YfcC family protein [unclassified Granulicatella]MBS4751150.1 YfcC family protein [Carnobacteriaceae bacterium zg-ZUI78]NEW63260.1 YfcC family protein [Granulicatella sp. zg-ZJ]NEW66746.1 YfcC family protein [Granulicatella sp. zg-84]QMI85410.1 YfcC family protein [Carnobacteriaceae bacterium zg-84]